MPTFFWELPVGLYMTFKGFRIHAPILTAADNVGHGATYSSAPVAKAGAA